MFISHVDNEELFGMYPTFPDGVQRLGGSVHRDVV
jgi:hypothetical protein